MPLIKSLSRKSNAGQLITYALRYVTHEKAISKNTNDATLILRHNIRARSVPGYIREFKENESYRLYKRKDSVILFHDIISFAPQDKKNITHEILKDFSKKYVSLRGNNNLYLIVRHSEKEHEHLHCIISGVALSGYSARISKQQFKYIKIELNKFQQEKYPELAHSLIAHEKNKTKSKEGIVQAVKNIRQTDKQSLIACLEKNYVVSNSTTDFLKRLQDQAYIPYYRNSRLQGVTVSGRKYRFSRLGFDSEKIEALNHNVTLEHKTLQELQSLRAGKKISLKMEMLPVEKKDEMLHEEPEQKMLAEFENIRSMQEDREMEERDLDDLQNCSLTENNQSYEDEDSGDNNISLYNQYALQRPTLFDQEDEYD